MSAEGHGLDDNLMKPPPASVREDLSHPTVDDDELASLFRAVAAETVEREPSPLETLRELSTRTRVVIAFVAAVAVGAVFLAILGVHPDSTSAGMLRYGIALSAVLGLTALAVALSLRGHHQRPLGYIAWGIAALTLAAPVLLGNLPGLWGTTQGHAHPGGGLNLGGRCFGVGLVTAAVIGLIVRFLQRDDESTSWRLAGVAGAGGLVAFGASQLHCPTSSSLHITVGHGLTGLVIFIVLVVISRLRRA